MRANRQRRVFPFRVDGWMRGLFAALVCTFAASANVNGVVAVNTAALVGSANGPFTLDFQFIEGNGIGDSANTVVLSNFSFGGGGIVTTSSTTAGGVTVSTGPFSITMVLSSFFQDAQFSFTPGTTLSFQFNATANVDTVAPDAFTFSILDKTMTEIATTNPNGFNTFLEVDVGAPSGGFPVIASAVASGNGATASAVPGSACDITGQFGESVADVQAIINQALGAAPATNDLNHDGKLSVVDIQIVINAALDLGCAADTPASISSTSARPQPSSFTTRIAPSPTNSSNGTETGRPSLVDIGSLGGPATIAHGLNNLGQVVGESDLGQAGSTCLAEKCPVRHAFLWDAGRMTDLGPFRDQDGVEGQANALNDAGQVVGTYKQAGGGSVGFVYGGNTRALISNVASSRARGINSSGETVGDFSTSGPESPSYAFAWPSGGVISGLSVVGGHFEYASAVNDLGQAAGSFERTGSSTHHAAVYSGGTAIDLGTLGGSNSAASAINNAGQVVGSSQVESDPSRHAFLYSDGKMLDLGTLAGLESQANAIDIHGYIVGWAMATAGQQHAFLWRSGDMVDLNTVVALGADTVLQDATAINDAGQIVANGSNGHAYLITLSADFR